MPEMDASIPRSATPLDANELQKRTIIEQAARAAVQEFALTHPELGQVPASSQDNAFSAGVKLAGGIFAALLTTGIGAVAFWTIGSITEMKTLLTEIKTAQAILQPMQEKRFADLENRATALEQKGQRNAPYGKN